MTFEVEINGEIRTVAIEPVGAAGPHGGTFRVALSGAGGAGARTSHEIQAARTDLGLSLLFAADHRSVDAAMTPRTAGECLVQTPRLTVAAVVDGRRFERTGPSEASGHGNIRAGANATEESLFLCQPACPPKRFVAADSLDTVQ